MNAQMEEIKGRLQAELTDAARSRQLGKEGRARVCARRAAGWAVGWYVESHNLADPHNNALDHLRWLAESPNAGVESREAAMRLVTKLAPDGSLPFKQDPIEDARRIIHALLGIEIETA